MVHTARIEPHLPGSLPGGHVQVSERERRDFFISYTRADRQWAEWIAWQLETAGYTTVLQAWDFGPAADFVHEMQKAMTNSERTIAVLSPSYIASVHGEAEWRAAYQRDPTGEQRILVPVRVADFSPPGLLATRVYIDLFGKDVVSAKAALLDGVRGQGSRPSQAPGFPGSPSPSFPGGEPSTAESQSSPTRGGEEREHLERLLAVHERNVRFLEQQEASYAGAAPVHLLTQLEDERAKVEQARAKLRGPSRPGLQ
jgi:hypothetical protein